MGTGSGGIGEDNSAAVRLRRVESWNERVSAEQPSQRIHGADGILSGGRDVAANAAEGLGPLLGPKHPGYFLLYLHHADVTFGQIIVERHFEVVHECEGFFAMIVKSFEQVAGFAFLASASFFPRTGGQSWQRVLGIAFIEDLLIASLKVLDLLFIKMVGGLSGLINGIFDFQQTVDHVIGPVLLVLLMHEDQLTQMVCIAQPM